MSTENKNAVRTDALELFSKQELDFAMFKTGERKNDDGRVAGLSLTVHGKKQVAKDLGVTIKDPRVLDAILKASDRLKVASIEKMAQIAASQDWTGKAARTSISKDGTLTATFAFKTVKRGPSITKDELVKALAAMSDEEQNDILNMAVSMQQESGPALEVPAIDNESTPLPEAAEA